MSIVNCVSKIRKGELSSVVAFNTTWRIGKIERVDGCSDTGWRIIIALVGDNAVYIDGGYMQKFIEGKGVITCVGEFKGYLDTQPVSPIPTKTISDKDWLSVLNGRFNSVTVGYTTYKVGKVKILYKGVPTGSEAYRIITDEFYAQGVRMVKYVSDGFTKEFMDGTYTHRSSILRTGELDYYLDAKPTKNNKFDFSLNDDTSAAIAIKPLIVIDSLTPTKTVSQSDIVEMNIHSDYNPFSDTELYYLIGKPVVCRESGAHYMITAVSDGSVYIHNAWYTAKELISMFTGIGNKILGTSKARRYDNI